MHRKTSIRVVARTTQADTVQYKNNEQYNTQKKNGNTEGQESKKMGPLGCPEMS
jgi:hypothetical protein